jgi:hypothetical protein
MNTLPQLEVPTYNVVIPSTKAEVSIRPFLVKEEKILMMAQESNNTKQVLSAMKDIINACTFNKVDSNALTSYDVEYLFLQLRAISVGETADLKFKCEECGAESEATINLKEIEVWRPAKPAESTIQLTDAVGITLKSLSLADMSNIDSNDENDITENIAMVIESIFDENTVYLAKDSSKEELHNFINTLTHGQLEKIQEFLNDQPKLSYVHKFDCASCAHKNELTLEGIQSFFT